MMTLTFDTSCINAKGKNQELNQLEAWQKQGLIHIVSSTSVEEEHLQTDDEPYRTHRLDKFRTYDEVDTAFWVLGYSRLGISTKLGTESTQEEMMLIASILFPGRNWPSLTPRQIRDVMALHTHWINSRDVFVTLNSKDFVGKNGAKQKYLFGTFGIVVMRPPEALDYVATMLSVKS